MRAVIIATAVVLAGLAAPALAQDAAPRPKIVVGVVKGKGGPNLAAPIKKLIEKPLKQSADLIPLAKYKAAAKKAKVKPNEMWTAQAAQSAGNSTGATHVLVIESAMQAEKVGKKKKQFFFANVTVVDVASGDVVLTKQYGLAGKKLTPDLADALLSDVTQALRPAPPPPAPEPEAAAEAPPPPDAPPAPDAPPPPEPAAEQPAQPAAEATLAAAPIDAPAPAEESAVTSESLSAITTPLPPASETVSIDAPRAGVASGRQRPAFHLAVGTLGMKRNGEITGSGNAKAPCYCGTKDEPNPFFPAGYLALELYPLALGGDGGVAEGIGIHLEGLFTQVKTVTDPVSRAEVTSSVTGGSGGLTFRYVFWDSPTAPDLKLKAGASYFAFPIAAGAFPGVHYLGKGYGGATFTVPIGTPAFAVTLGGTYTMMVDASGKAKRLGKQEAGNAIHTEGGFKLHFAPIEVSLLGRWDQITTTYKGETSLENSTPITDAKMVDSYFGAILAAGLAF